MYISTQHVPDAHPVDTAWVDRALSTAGDPLGTLPGDPLGALIGRPLGAGDGIMITGWSAPGPDRLALLGAHLGSAPGPARFMQVVGFDGPRSQEWADAEEFASTRRLWPATRDIPGIVCTLRLRAADNAVTIVTLAETADAIDDGIRAVMSTTLLPEENPALLSRPDRMGVYRLMHADLPIEGSRA
ncbi:hypothetical protein ACFO1B_12510 [Dactylosporangium siamense]|uniref:Uncharacterized protein n=1 Tax=Dactylosporangium siamense TaxID=685454 RepID=A0A919UEY2_9ACTN|nr:hypothetical protein [Dactylosporangium siamense]GIG49105.1 hypothetical protein Dsi01nite_071460 [Dactylosporangium siamense]